ncbi:MAG TPA: diacylglycerol kinase family protein, partial [Chitinophaga sp.]
MLTRLDIIINPGSGKEEPVLSWLGKALMPTGINWKAHIITHPGEATSIARSLAGHTDAVAVYGGDGTVMEVAQGLFQTSTPMAIIPGGTANVMAKELAIPTDTQAAIALLTSGRFAIKPVDMGLVNDIPFLIRVNMGIFSDMITEASPDLKDRWGQWAYGITALQTLQKATPAG